MEPVALAWRFNENDLHWWLHVRNVLVGSGNGRRGRSSARHGIVAGIGSKVGSWIGILIGHRLDTKALGYEDSGLPRVLSNTLAESGWRAPVGAIILL